MKTPIIFHYYWSAHRGKSHVQLESGQIPCGTKGGLNYDGSVDQLSFDGSEYVFIPQDKRMFPEIIKRPITCLKCERWLEDRFQEQVNKTST